MKKQLIAACLLCYASLISGAQTFKGHSIGETPDQFLKAEPTIAVLVDDCKARRPRPLTDDEILQQYGKKRYEKFKKQNVNGKLVAYSSDPDAWGDKCAAIMSIITDGEGEVNGFGYQFNNQYAKNLQQKFTDLLSSPGTIGDAINLAKPLNKVDSQTFTFKGGKLYHFSRQVGASYEDVRDDITERVGSSPKILSTPYQNAYGARWEDLTAIWVNKTIAVKLYHDGNPTGAKSPMIEIMTAGEYEALLNKSRSKPLD